MYTQILRHLIEKTAWNPTEEQHKERYLKFLDAEDQADLDSAASRAAAAEEQASGAQGEPAPAATADESKPAAPANAS